MPRGALTQVFNSMKNQMYGELQASVEAVDDAAEGGRRGLPEGPAHRWRTRSPRFWRVEDANALRTALREKKPRLREIRPGAENSEVKLSDLSCAIPGEVDLDRRSTHVRISRFNIYWYASSSAGVSVMLTPFRNAKNVAADSDRLVDVVAISTVAGRIICPYLLRSYAPTCQALRR